MLGGLKRNQRSFPLAVNATRCPAFDPGGAGNATSRSSLPHVPKCSSGPGYFASKAFQARCASGFSKSVFIMIDPVCMSWVSHVLGLDEGVEFFGGDKAELDGGIAEADLGVVGGLGDLGGVVVPDLGDESGDEHHGIVDVMIDLLAIGFDAGDAVVNETVAGICEEFDGVEIIENHDGL